MAFVTGQKGSEDLAAFRVHFDLHRKILELEPDSQPLTVFLNNVYQGGRRMAVKTKKFRWSEYELDNRFDAVNNGAGYTSGDTSIVVDDGDKFFAEVLVKVPRTGEVIRVDSVSTDTLTVVRGYGDSTAAALVDDDPLFIIGAAREEGDTSKPARTREPSEVYNFTQIFRTWVDMTGTQLSSDDDTQPHDWPFQQKVRMIEHQKEKELTFWFGTRGETAGVTHNIRTTAGVAEYATANNSDAGGTLTEVEFENFLRPGLRFGKREKVLFASPLLVSVLNNFSQGKLQTTVGDKMFGVSISRWISGHGEIKVVKHNLFEGDEYGGYGYLLDFEAPVAYKYLNGQSSPGGPRDTQIKTNVQANDADGRKDEILAECGLQFPLPKRHAVLTGVTG